MKYTYVIHKKIIKKILFQHKTSYMHANHPAYKIIDYIK